MKKVFLETLSCESEFSRLITYSNILDFLFILMANPNCIPDPTHIGIPDVSKGLYICFFKQQYITSSAFHSNLCTMNRCRGNFRSKHFNRDTTRGSKEKNQALLFSLTHSLVLNLSASLKNVLGWITWIHFQLVTFSGFFYVML